MAFVEVYAVPIAIQGSTGLKIFTWFCLTCACVLTVVLWMAKETKGLSLEQVDLLWAS
jgi:hypothetical protein